MPWAGVQGPGDSTATPARGTGALLEASPHAGVVTGTQTPFTQAHGRSGVRSSHPVTHSQPLSPARFQVFPTLPTPDERTQPYARLVYFLLRSSPGDVAPTPNSRHTNRRGRAAPCNWEPSSRSEEDQKRTAGRVGINASAELNTKPVLSTEAPPLPPTPVLSGGRAPFSAVIIHMTSTIKLCKASFFFSSKQAGDFGHRTVEQL